MKLSMRCPICDAGELIVSESKRAVEIEGSSLEIPVRSHACNACGMVQATDEDARANARAMRKATKEARRQLTGIEVRQIRQRLCITQEQSARIFGGGPVAFSKYENDEIVQSESMDRLIWLVGQFPWLIGSLAERAGVELSTSTFLIAETHRVTYEESYLARANELIENARAALEGFAPLVRASNDERIYRPNVDARTKLRSAA